MRGERATGAVLEGIVLGTATWVVLASAAAGVLALAGLWQPLVAGSVLLVLAAVSVRLVRGLPSRSLPLWSAAFLVVVSVGFTVWAGTTHAEQVLPRRDAGSTFQSALDLAERHTRPIDVSAASVGGAEVLSIDGLTLASPAFYSIGTAQNPVLQPQFLVGPAALTSVGEWVGGPTGMFWVPAVASGLLVLAVGLLTCRLVGPRWGPLAATACAICFPLLRVARSTYSEPYAVLVLVAGLLALAAASGRRVGRAATRCGLLAGGLVGGAALVRPDALRETLLLAVVLGLAAVQRQPWVRAAAISAAATTLVAAVLALVVSSAYLDSISASLIPLAGLLGVTILAAGVAVWFSRRGFRLPTLVMAWLPRATGAITALALLLLVTRPLWQTVRQSAADSGARVVAVLQQAQGLPVDGGRTYAESTVPWLAWWVGWPVLVLAAVVAILLMARAAQHWVDESVLPPWVGPLLIGLGSTVLTLYRPGITPDHPWADRRLLVALPFVIVLGVAAAAQLSRWSTRRMPFLVAPALSVLVGLVVLVPTGLATWPHRAERVEAGSLAAVEQACAAFEDGDVVLALDDRAANEWPQVLRGQCDVPTIATTAALRRDPAALVAAVQQANSLVAAAGHQLVLVSARDVGALDAVGATGIRQVVDAEVLEDPRLLEERPEDLVPLSVSLWTGTLAPGES